MGAKSSEAKKKELGVYLLKDKSAGSTQICSADVSERVQGWEAGCPVDLGTGLDDHQEAQLEGNSRS